MDESRGMFKVLSVLILLTSILSCSWEQKRRPSILLIAVEKLNADEISCVNRDQSNTKDGFDFLCDEFIRFTHAFTPSTMAQPTLASVLTGLYPFEHGLWHNGHLFLKEKYNSIAELALENKMRTSFYSGGGAIWRKSGLAQGFEVFDDNVPIALNSFYRPISKSNKLFLKWLNKLNGDESFFSLLYYPDLLFYNIATRDVNGQERGKNFDGQKLEIKENLKDLVIELKNEKRWDDSYIFFFGLNGVSLSERVNELSPIDLHSDNTRVSLFIKPPRKKRDKGLFWKVDANVSLVDIGATVLELFGIEKKKSSGVSAKSLLSMIETQGLDWPTERPIILESAWGQWKAISNTRSALIKSKKLFYNQEPLIFYNTLIDRRESILSIAKENLKEEEYGFVKSKFKSAYLEPWEGLDYFELRKWKVARNLWFHGMDSYISDELKILVNKIENPNQVHSWLAYFALKNNNWEELQDLGNTYDVPEWVYVARKNMGKSVKKVELKNHCFAMLTNKKVLAVDNERYKKVTPTCDDKIHFELKKWSISKNSKRELHREAFLRTYIMPVLKKSLFVQNYISGFIFDMNLAQLDGPSTVELFLSLPENKGMKNFVGARLEGSLFSD